MEEKSNKSKKGNLKILLIIVAIIVLMAIIAMGIYFGNINNKPNNINDITKIYDEYLNKEQYSITVTSLVNENSEYYAKSGNMAYTYTDYGTSMEKELVKDGSTYFINDRYKEYFKYENNDLGLTVFTTELNNFNNGSYIEGMEKIENKNYEYQEYEGITKWVFDNEIYSVTENVKTRFYFDKGELVYIKTITPKAEEIVKVEISDDITDAIFEIPSDYIEN